MAERDAFDIAYNAVLRSWMSETFNGDDHGCDGPADESEAEQLLQALGSSLPEQPRPALLADLRTALETAKDSELQQVLEAGDMVSLPLHPVQEAEVRERLAAFEAFLQRLCSEAGLGSRPRAVTIARSVVDGFCPMRWLCALEGGLLEVLRRCLGDLDVLYADELDTLELA